MASDKESVNQGPDGGTDDGGFSPRPTSNTSLLDTGLVNLATRTTLLSFFIIAGVVGNCVLVATIAQSTRLKGRVMNLFVFSAAIVNLLDCLGNMPLILGATIREKWDYGDFACHLNGFGMQHTTVCMLLSLQLMSLDRFQAARNPEKYAQSLSKFQANILIIYTWIHALAFSFPLILGNPVPVEAYPARYSCSIKSGASLVYVSLTSIFCFLLPLVAILVFFVYIIIASVRRGNKRSAGHIQDVYSQVDEVREIREKSAAKYVGLLVALWVLLEAPYITLTFIEQYRTTSEIESLVTINISYPWEVEFALTWMKLSYPTILPIVTLGWKKEVWQRFKNFLLCRKSNHVVDASPKLSPGHRNGDANGSSNRRSELSSFSSVPVLFATENGLHLQTYSKRIAADDESDVIVNDNDYKQVNGSQILTARQCDVLGSQDLKRINEDEDTSDYDSHVDPFNNSNAASVQSDLEIINRQQKRSERKSGSLSGVTFSEDIVSENSGTRRRDGGRRGRDETVCMADEVVSDNKSRKDDQVSHDSGRGSMEERSKKRRRKQRLADTEAAIVSRAADTEVTTVTATIETDVVITEPVENYNDIENKPKKKRKKKNILSLKQTEGTRELPPVGRKSASRPLPPLKNTNAEGQGADSREGQCDVITTHDERENDPRQTYCVNIGKNNTQRMRSNSVTTNMGAPPQTIARCISVNTCNELDANGLGTEPEGTSSISNSHLGHSRKSRGSTKLSDSQTALLGSSNTSTELSDMSNAGRELGTQTPQYPPQAAPRRSKLRGDHFL